MFVGWSLGKEDELKSSSDFSSVILFLGLAIRRETVRFKRTWLTWPRTHSSSLVSELSC